MFRKRIKKTFPAGTFIPTPARVCAIIQLCLAFSVLLWNASEPFIGEIFYTKSGLLLYYDVMGIPAHDHAIHDVRLARNSQRFDALPKQTKEHITQNLQALQTKLKRSFWDKLKSTVTLFTDKISPFELAWIFFSIVIAIMLLKKVEGAAQAVWLLPFLVACYAIETRLSTKEKLFDETNFFPTEKMLVENYIQKPLSEDIFEQQKELMEGWKRYLIDKWAGQTPSEAKKVFDRQAEEGEFHFNLARLKWRANQNHLIGALPPPSPALWQLVLYFFWNVYFAYTTWKYTHNLIS